MMTKGSHQFDDFPCLLPNDPFTTASVYSTNYMQ